MGNTPPRTHIYIIGFRAKEVVCGMVAEHREFIVFCTKEYSSAGAFIFARGSYKTYILNSLYSVSDKGRKRHEKKH